MVWLWSSYERSVDVINRSLAGWTTRDFVENALPLVTAEVQERYDPTVITLWLGTNDAATEDSWDSETHVPVQEYHSNLLAILAQLQAHAAKAHILLMTPPPVQESMLATHLETIGRPTHPLMRRNEETAKYASVCREVAATLERVELVDLFRTSWKCTERSRPQRSDQAVQRRYPLVRLWQSPRVRDGAANNRTHRSDKAAAPPPDPRPEMSPFHVD